MSDTAEVTLWMRGLGGQRISNVFHVKNADGSAMDALGLGLAATRIADWYTDTMRARISDNIVGDYVIARIAGVPSSITHIVSSINGQAGLRTGTNVPANVSFAIQFRTTQGGRRGLGRKYVPGMLIDDVAGNQVTQAFADAWKAAYETLRATFSDTPNQRLAVYSRVNNASAEVTFVTYTDLFVDSQRRRLTGRGV